MSKKTVKIMLENLTLTLAISLSNAAVFTCPKSPPSVTLNDANNSCNFLCKTSFFLSLVSRSSRCVLNILEKNPIEIKFPSFFFLPYA